MTIRNTFAAAALAAVLGAPPLAAQEQGYERPEKLA